MKLPARFVLGALAVALTASSLAYAQKDRADRRRHEVAMTRARWGALVRDPAVQAELRLHAQHVARIDAIDRVARQAHKDALLPRIAKLREMETSRFENHMAALKQEKAK